MFDLLVKSLNSRKDMLHFRLNCSCFISFPSVHTSLFMFYLISFRPHFIDHGSFLFPSVHSPSHSFINHSPSHLHFTYLVALILHGRSTWSVLFLSQSRLWKLTIYKFL